LRLWPKLAETTQNSEDEQTEKLRNTPKNSEKLRKTPKNSEKLRKTMKTLKPAGNKPNNFENGPHTRRGGH
jgi:hypothetical protein